MRLNIRCYLANAGNVQGGDPCEAPAAGQTAGVDTELSNMTKARASSAYNSLICLLK